MDAHRLEDCSKEFQQFYLNMEPAMRVYLRFLASHDGGWASLDIIYLAGQNNGLQIARNIQKGIYKG